MTTCDNDHEPITFEGEFRALCPLCAMRLKLAEAEESALESAAGTIAEEEIGRLNAEGERDDLRDKLDKIEEERDALSDESDMLLGVLRGLVAAFKEGDPQYSMSDKEGMMFEAAQDAIHEAERRRKN